LAQEEQVEEMTPSLMDEEAAILAELKKWGEENVRNLVATNQLSLVYRDPALRWIEEIDRASAEESERRKNASIDEAMTGRSETGLAYLSLKSAQNHPIRAELGAGSGSHE
jgi:hypothetical protein